ncbi:MAG TPA: molybdate ABC transporter substrate-binding protein, partial [Vicinamibacterales bacterium]|nr:molybdate ABC transporter substrate-binding protein [Vicinamibacterales bacterium]
MIRVIAGFSARRCAALRAAAGAILALGAAVSAAGQPLRIAAASDLQAALPSLASEFERSTGQRVALTFGSSGNFFTQLQNGAPFDVFLSADIDYPRQLERDGTAETGSLYNYASGRIVLWTRADSPLDLKRGLAALADPSVRRIAIANPDHAPYGRAAVAALHHEGIYDRVLPKLVRGENIAQAAQFVQSGNADAGIVALSLAMAPGLAATGRYVDIPESFYPRIEQAAVVIAASKQKDAARQFLEFLKRPESVRTLRS